MIRDEVLVEMGERETDGEPQIDSFVPVPAVRELQGAQDLRPRRAHTMAHVLGRPRLRTPRRVLD